MLTTAVAGAGRAGVLAGIRGVDTSLSLVSLSRHTLKLNILSCTHLFLPVISILQKSLTPGLLKVSSRSAQHRGNHLSTS